MKTINSRLMVGAIGIASALTLAGCFSSSSDDDAPELTERTATGQLTAPNGSTPIGNATVYYESNGGGSMPMGAAIASTGAGGMGNSGCASPPGNAAFTCTNADGSFSLTFEAPSGAANLVAFKGSWTLNFTVSDDDEDLGVVAFSNDPAQGAPRIAVVSGTYDSIQNVLAKLGMADVDEEDDSGATIMTAAAHGHDHDHQHEMVALYGESAADTATADANQIAGPSWLGSETFRIYRGSGGNFGLDPEEYDDYTELFETGDNGVPRLYDYDIVYINCSTSPPSGEYPNWASEIEQYVAQGGAIYATDLASPWVSEPFSDFVERGSSGTTPSEGLAANTSLHNALGVMSCTEGPLEDDACLTEEGRVPLSGFLGGWHLLNPRDSDAGDSVAAVVTDVEEERNLTLLFPYGSEGGAAFFSSYHTSSGASLEGYTPQERVLEFLFYEGVTAN